MLCDWRCDLRQAEIENLDEAVAGNHQILGLQVPVRDARFMRLGQPLGNLRRDFNGFAYGQRAGCQQLAQRLPFDQFHRDVMSGTSCAEFVDRDDVGVIQRGSRARFAFEATQMISVSG